MAAKFLDEQKFTWDLFKGYDNLRVLTYSASVAAIVRMLDKYSFDSFECVFGYEGVLRDIKDMLSFQKVVIGNTRAAIMGLKDDDITYPGEGICRQSALLCPKKIRRPRKTISSFRRC